MNTHRSSKSGCEKIINHYKKTCVNEFNFNIQVIIKLEGDGKDELGQIDQEKLEERLKYEDNAIKSLRTLYPYGLDERSKKKSAISENIGSLFPLFHAIVSLGVKGEIEIIEKKY